MAETVEEIGRKLRVAIEPGFRARLTARGAARAMVWRNGVLPEDSPDLGPQLTEELLGHGFGLMRLALKAREAGMLNDEGKRGFELAAESLEYRVKNGNQEDESRGFYRIVAAASYHLGGFSARAFSLLARTLDDQNLAVIERALALLILRRLDDLDSLILSELSNPERSDQRVAERLYDADDVFTLDDALVVAANENYLKALAAFLFSIRAGDQTVLAVSLARLQDGEELCSQVGLVSTWWIYRITKLLLEDLWSASMQQLLPQTSGDSSDWPRLREIFVGLLSSRATSELDLWPSQIAIASRVIDPTDDIVASLPTSAGKTRIAELCILRALSLGQRVVFVTPLRSLSAQTERTLKQTFRPLGFDVSSLYGSAGSSIFDLDSLSNRPIVVSTPEKLDFALRNNPDLLNEVGLVVLDEGHMLGANEREVRYEVLIQRLLRRSDANHRRLVTLSAMLPSGDELDDFVNWLRNDEPGEPITSEWRPTRQRFGEIVWTGTSARYELELQEGTKTFIQRFVERSVKVGPRGGKKIFPSKQNELVLAAAWRLVSDGHSVLIYCPERRSVNAIAKTLLLVHQQGFLSDLQRFDPTVAERAISVGSEWLGRAHPALQCLSLGVAVHHASLPRAFLREIDSLIREKKVPIVIASPTLARGLNISASCVLFQSAERFDVAKGKRLPITAEEFANVAGRAGRAYVDLDGQVLGVCYKREHVGQWRNLRSLGQERHLESGLIQIVVPLFNGLKRKLGAGGDVLEYVLNTSDIWKDPPGTEKQLSEWKAALATMDLALLSLIGEGECSVEDVAGALDEVLASSFLHRRLKRKNELAQTLVPAVLSARAKHICATTTVNQRRGYFFSGVGLTTGNFLDENAIPLNAALSAADAAIRLGQHETCITSLLDLAELVFKVEPFIPHPFPESWKEIARGWFEGQVLGDLQGISEDANSFVEDGLVYKLAWAAEAIRVRSRANEEGVFGDRPSPVVAAIETGTVSIPESLLLQSGLSSRVAARKAIQEVGGSFEDVIGMWLWLYSTPVREASAIQDWPTPDTRSSWLEFINSQRLARDVQLDIKELELSASFNSTEDQPQIGASLMVRQTGSGEVLKIYTPEMVDLGVADSSSLKTIPRWACGQLVNENTISIRYVGAD
jgi:superfamily II DNA/RNA helicase